MTASISDSDVVSGTGASSHTSKSMSWLSGDVVAVFTNGRDNTGSLSSVSTTGSGLSFSAQETNQSVGRTQGGLHTAVATAGSSGTITATFSEAMDSSQAHFFIVTDADTIEVSGAATGSTDTPTVDVTPTSSDTLVLGVGGVGSKAPDMTAGTSYTFVTGHEDISSGAGGNASVSSVEENNETSTSAVTVDMTLDSASQWVMFAMAIGTAGGGTVVQDIISSGLIPFAR